MTSSCWKYPYTTFHDAQKQLRLLKKLGASGRKRREAHAYQCSHCGQWHLTSQPQRKVRA